MDILGTALADYFRNGNTETLWVHTSYDTPEEMPVEIFFRNAEEMPELESIALEHCRGKILDAGAGAGSHALLLQEAGKAVTALDISPKAVQVMRQRGVKTAVEGDLFDLQEQQFDTILFLMNGIGLTGTIAGLSNFLEKARVLLNPGGQLIFDSSDIAYLYHGDLPRPAQKYFGEVSFRYEYKNQEGAWFDWLYIDQETLEALAEKHGWACTILYEDGEDQFLAKLEMQAAKN